MVGMLLTVELSSSETLVSSRMSGMIQTWCGEMKIELLMLYGFTSETIQKKTQMENKFLEVLVYKESDMQLHQEHYFSRTT